MQHLIDDLYHVLPNARQPEQLSGQIQSWMGDYWEDIDDKREGKETEEATNTIATSSKKVN